MDNSIQQKVQNLKKGSTLEITLSNGNTDSVIFIEQGYTYIKDTPNSDLVREDTIICKLPDLPPIGYPLRYIANIEIKS